MLKSKKKDKKKREKEKETKKRITPPVASTSKANGKEPKRTSSNKKQSKKSGGGNGVYNSDVLSFEQKKDLSETIQTLDGDKLERVIQIIHDGVPEVRDVRSAFMVCVAGC